VCHDAAKRAVELAGPAAPAERALIEAILLRFPQPGPAPLPLLMRWHEAFTSRMRQAYREHSRDLDIVALFVEAAITRTPRMLWNIRTGQPQPGADTLECVEALTRAVGEMDASHTAPHPGVLHMYLHAMEMSPTPELALPAADLVRDLARDEGHLHHMPAHIYVQCADYAQSVAVSQRAIAVDDLYVAWRGATNFYTTARCHDLHLCMFAAMFMGHYRFALDAADRIRATATSDLIARSFPFMATILDGYSAMRTHVQVRFGQWRALIAEPAPEMPGLTPIRAAMHAYGQGVAYAALGRVSEAEAAHLQFDAAMANIPSDAVFLSNPVTRMLAVGEAMLDGEIEYRKGNYARAFGALRLAVERDDGLSYTEPWAWMHPPRHALGALLAEQGEFVEAEDVFRSDLGLNDRVARCTQHLDNVWALSGLMECLEHKGTDGERTMVARKLMLAQARTDRPVMSACCCRGGP
jgi:tetratricopeptide (TPR) repeat protein